MTIMLKCCLIISELFDSYYTGPMRRGFSGYIGPGPAEPRRDPWISEGPHNLSHTRFVLIFDFFGGIFNSNPQFWERSHPVYGAPKQSWSTLQNFSWRPWLYSTHVLYIFKNPVVGSCNKTIIRLKSLRAHIEQHHHIYTIQDKNLITFVHSYTTGFLVKLPACNTVNTIKAIHH